MFSWQFRVMNADDKDRKKGNFTNAHIAVPTHTHKHVSSLCTDDLARLFGEIEPFFLMFLFSVLIVQEKWELSLWNVCVWVCTGHTLSVLEACKYLCCVCCSAKWNEMCVFFLQQKENNVRPTTTETTPRSHATQQAEQIKQFCAKQPTRRPKTSKNKGEPKRWRQSAYTRPYQPR